MVNDNGNDADVRIKGWVLVSNNCECCAGDDGTGLDKGTTDKGSVIGVDGTTGTCEAGNTLDSLNELELGNSDSEGP